MIEGLRPYPAYKDSGVPWLGKVPAHWEVKPLKRVVGLNPSRSEARSSLESDKEATFLPMERVGVDGHIDARDRRPTSTISNGFTYFRRQDVILAKITPCFENGKGACLDRLPTPIGFGSTEFVVLRSSGALVPRFLYRTTTLPEFRKLGSDAMIGAAGQQRVPLNFIADFRAPIPPLLEQRAVVRFLDHADRRIQRYIRAKQKLIALLNEHKQAIIHRAVTRGLDPNVRLKPSGVEWLDGVPEHWTSFRLKAVLSRPLRNGLFKKKDDYGTGVPLVNVSDVYRDDFRIEPQTLERVRVLDQEIRTFEAAPGDLFVVRSSLKLEGTGRAAYLVVCSEPCVFECHLVQARPKRATANSRFVALQLNSWGLRHFLISRANVVTMATVAQPVIGSCPVWLPPIAEQNSILLDVDRQCSALVSAAARASAQIQFMREFRTRLIADVVTGKLDVREAAARLPEEVEEEDVLKASVEEESDAADGEPDLAADDEDPEAV